MNVREWALIAFTILAQMSVGAFLVRGVVYYFAARKAGAGEAERMTDRALLIIMPTMLLALLVSLVHLGNPLNAYRAVANLGVSWLSREILAGVLFALFGSVFTLLQWRKLGSSAVRAAFAWLAALCGIALVLVMPYVYLLRTQPAWDTFATPVAFLATSLLLGALGVGAVLVANYAYVLRVDPGCEETQCTLLRSAVRWIAIAAVLVLGVELIATPLQAGLLAAAPSPAAQASVELLYGQYAVLLATRLVLLFVGVGVLGLFLYQAALTAGREKLMGNLAYAAFALVLVSEVLSRFLFYAAHVRIGI